MQYQKAIQTLSSSDKESLHAIECHNGLAKVLLRLGEMTKGLKLLESCQDTQLLFECGMILDQLKMYNEAGHLFERAGNINKAAMSYLKCK